MIMSELCLDIGPNFEEVYRDSLINYYFGLNEERSILKNRAELDLMAKLVITVLDCYSLEKEFADPNFDFVAYNDKIENLEGKIREQYIENKCSKMLA